MAKQPIDTGPAQKSAAYLEMFPKWQMIQTLLDGSGAMRQAQRTYLPQHEGESNWAYAERLGRSTLLNMTQLTLDSWVGKPFSEPVKVGDDVPDQIKDLLKNVDLQGNDLNVFSRNWFRTGVAKGFAHVLAEFPRTTPKADGKPRTLADDREEKLRPYLVLIPPENLIFAHAEIQNGVEVLTQVRILEEHIELSKDGFSEKAIKRIRVITPGHVEIYIEKPDPKDKKRIIWVIEDEYDFDLDFIPLVTFYADRTDFMMSKPPLEDLAYMNVSHWQSRSDQIAVLTVARVPIMAVSGAIGDDRLTVGPNKWLNCPDPAGRFYYVEHSGKAIEAGRKDLEDLEQTMSEYGAIFLIKRPGGATATASALKTAEITSPLQDMTIRFQSALTQAIQLLGSWINIEEIGTFSINIDFSLQTGDLPHLTAIQTARQLKDISRSYFCKALGEFHVLPDDFDQQENDKELLEEQEEASEQQLSMATALSNINPPKPPAAAEPAPNAGQQQEEKSDKNAARTANQT